MMSVDMKLNILIVMIAILMIMVAYKLYKTSEGYGACANCAKVFADKSKTRPSICGMISDPTIRSACMNANKLDQDKFAKYVDGVDAAFSKSPSWQQTCASNGVACGNANQDMIQTITSKYEAIASEAQQMIDDYQNGNSTMSYDDLNKMITDVSKKLDSIRQVYNDLLQTGDAAKAQQSLSKL